MLKLKFRLKTVWNKDRFQPINDEAIFLAKVVGKETLSRDQLITCKDAGCSIHIPNFDVEKYLSDDYEV